MADFTRFSKSSLGLAFCDSFFCLIYTLESVLISDLFSSKSSSDNPYFARSFLRSPVVFISLISPSYDRIADFTRFSIFRDFFGDFFGEDEDESLTTFFFFGFFSIFISRS